MQRIVSHNERLASGIMVNFANVTFNGHFCASLLKLLKRYLIYGIPGGVLASINYTTALALSMYIHCLIKGASSTNTSSNLIVQRTTAASCRPVKMTAWHQPRKHQRFIHPISEEYDLGTCPVAASLN